MNTVSCARKGTSCQLLPLVGHNLDESLVDTYKFMIKKFSLDKNREFQDRNYEHYWVGPIREQR